MSESSPSSEGNVSNGRPPSGGTSATTVSEDNDRPPSAAGREPIRRWSDWRWQMSHRLRTAEQLRRFFGASDVADAAEETTAKFPMAITPYYGSLIRRFDDSDPIFRMAVPQPVELFNPSYLKDDPLEETDDMPVEGLVHRYPDRALLVTTTTCAMYCRYCTRKRAAGVREAMMTPTQLHRAVAYLRSHPEIRDVIVSGGDPFTLATEPLSRVLAAIR